MMTPRLSIIVPLYNKGPFIEATLRSFASQLSAAEEVLIVDDQSTDDGPEIARTLLKELSISGEVLTLPQNGGPATARNLGARHASSSHLLFFDADDIPMPNLVQVLRHAIDGHPSIDVFAFKIAFQARGETVPLKDELGTPSFQIRPRHAFVMDSLNGKALCTASSTCVSRAAFLQANGGFLEGLRYCEDPELWARLSANHEILEIHETLSIYRDVSTSLSYGQRAIPGSLSSYVNSLLALSSEHGDAYLRLARLMLLKNIVFSRSLGASRAEVDRQLAEYERLLGRTRFLQLRCVNSVPSILFKAAKALRTRIGYLKQLRRRYA